MAQWRSGAQGQEGGGASGNQFTVSPPPASRSFALCPIVRFCRHRSISNLKKRGRAFNSPEESVNENILLSLDQNDEELVMLMRIRDSRVRLLLPPLSPLVNIKSSPGSGWKMSEPRWNFV